MRRSIVCGLLVCALAVADAARAQTRPIAGITEADAVARFMANDARVRAVTTRLDEVRALQAERSTWPNPTFTYAREHVFDSDDTFLLGRQELPISGRLQRLREAGSFAIEAAVAETRRQLVALQAEVRIAHAELLAAQAREAELQRAIDALQQLIEVLRAREREGEGSQYDRMRGERAMLDLRAELASAAAGRAAAQGRLAAFLGPGVSLESLTAVDVTTPRVEPAPIASLIERATSSRGEVRSTASAVSQFEAERAAASRLRVPTPTVSGGLKRGSVAAASSSGYQFSVDLNLPLFHRGQAALALATAQKARAEAELAAWRSRIEVEVRTAAAVVSIHEQRLDRFRNDIATIVEPLAQIGRVGYEEGELGILELLDAERQALDARLRVLELTAASRRAAIELDRAIGLEMQP